MTSHTTERFRRAFQALSPSIQRRARVAYARFRVNPFHPSLQFKQVHSTRPIYSARVGLGYRALGAKQDDVIVWFWIGSHSEYDRLVSSREGG